jgi:hypothetical protein
MFDLNPIQKDLVDDDDLGPEDPEMEQYWKDNPDRLARFIGRPSDYGYRRPSISIEECLAEADREIAEYLAAQETSLTPQV